MFDMKFFLILTVFIRSSTASAVCYKCFGNNETSGSFCSIDRMCIGTSCFFNYKADGSWSAGCDTFLTTNFNITCFQPSTGGGDASCSCNSDFCNSFQKSSEALSVQFKDNAPSRWIGSNRKSAKTLKLAQPTQNLIYCQECGTFSVGNTSFTIPCNTKNVCQANFCISLRGATPYSFCAENWNDPGHPACHMKDYDPEICICSMHMCNVLLEPEIPHTTPIVSSDVTIATPKLVDSEHPANPSATEADGKKKKCRNGKFAPNDQAVSMGEKLKDAIVGGFGSGDGVVQSFEADINDHICSYSDNSDEAQDKLK